MSRSSLGVLLAATALSALAVGSVAIAAESEAAPKELSAKELASVCALLDNPKKRALMDALELRLLHLCGRTNELGRVKSAYVEAEQREAGRTPGTDVLVNDPNGEAGVTQTQSETSIAINEVTGTLCSGFNDAYSGVVQGLGYTGFSRSTDGGATFTDGGALSSSSFGDPSVVWRKADGRFYFAALHSSDGLGMWRSSDDCQTFHFLALGHSGLSDDKELLAVDNNPASPNYGRIYMVWTDFNAGARIFATHSDDGSVWTPAVALSATNIDVQGAWPIVAPDGTVYVGWVRWNPYFSGPIDIEIARSTNGGTSFALVTNPATGKVTPYDSTPTTSCGRPALRGNVRYLPSPQLAVTPNGDLHAVYSYDPDGRNVGDIVNVYYRRSTDQGATWEPEFPLNDDGTLTDQYFPTLSAGTSGRLVSTWYDRRLDAGNTFVDYYSRTSDDGGLTWQPSERVSDVSSPIYLDPNLATCYHGDYDQQIQIEAASIVQWADDRAVRSAHNDPDVYVDRNQLLPDFAMSAQQTARDVCAPAQASYDLSTASTLGFSDPVTLAASGNPAGTTVAFSVNPVVPPGSSAMTLGNTAAGAPGTYQIDVTGSAGALQRTVQVSLKLSTSVPDAVVPSAPADGATGQPNSPTFGWTAPAQADSYVIEIATDADFTNIADASPVAGTSYTTPVVLASDTIHYWRVRALNTCGDGAYSATYSFRTTICRRPALAIPDASPAGVNDTLLQLSGGTLTDLNLSLAVTHTYVGDLKFVLTHVDTGTSVQLIDRPGVPALGATGCSGNNIAAILDDEAATPVESECVGATPTIAGTFIPQAALAAFDGEDLSGTWTLNAADVEDLDLGAVTEWCLLPTVEVVVSDTDADGQPDDQDNCTLAANANQRDTDGDGFGNLCDGDFDQNCAQNFADLGIVKASFFALGDLATDMNGDGTTNFSDLGLLKAAFFAAPGPSGIPNICD